MVDFPHRYIHDINNRFPKITRRTSSFEIKCIVYQFVLHLNDTGLILSRGGQEAKLKLYLKIVMICAINHGNDKF